MPEVKNSLLEALKPVLEEASSLQAALQLNLPVETKTAKDLAAHVFQNSGKQIRPALFFMSCDLFSYSGPHRLPMAVVCEYVHTASLLHDDVIDNSTLRRHKPTANSIWGDEAAVLVGDLIYARASEMMAETGQLEIVRSFASAICKMSEGELLQLESLFCLDSNEKSYLMILERKTAILIATACKTAALLAGAPAEQEHALYEFGRLVGLSFQILDDALDYLSSESLSGKPIGSDLRDGRVTLPVILLKPCLNEEERLWFIRLFEGDKPSFAEEDLQKVSQLVQKYRTAHLALEKARALTDQAIELLNSHFSSSAARDRLETLTKTLLSRLY